MLFSDSAIYIILVVITVIVLYVGYSFWRNPSKQITFEDCSTQTTIKGSLLTNPNSVNFAYGGWFYVSNFQNTNSIKNLFRRQSTANTLSTINAYLGANSTVLYVQACAGPPSNTNEKNKLIVSKSFPLQKWVNILVSVDGGKTCDIYLDGKMVATFILKNQIYSQPDSEDGIICGPFDGYVANFKTWGYSVDPQTVWNYYLQGSGRGETLGGLDSYGLKMQITKNGDVANTLKVI